MTNPRNRSAEDGVYTRPDRPGFWISYVDAQGKRRQRLAKGAGTVSEAKAIRTAEMFRVDQTKVYGTAPPADDDFAVVAARFLRHQKARLSAAGYQRDHDIVENHLKPFFPAKLAAIRRGDVMRYITDRSEHAGPATVAKEINVLKHLLRLAVDWEMIPTNPAQGVKAPKAPAGRVRYLQPTELKVLVAKCPPWLRAFVMLAVTTGMRRGEILGLRWLDLDVQHGRILLPQTKNGQGRVVYLNVTARAALESVPAAASIEPTDPVFLGLTPHQVSVAFRRAVKSAGIADFRLHDLRHTAASWMRMQGADIHTVAQLLGHKDLRMAARYQHLSPEYLADAVKGLDAVFGKTRYRSVTAKRLPKPRKRVRGLK